MVISSPRSEYTRRLVQPEPARWRFGPRAAVAAAAVTIGDPAAEAAVGQDVSAGASILVGCWARAMMSSTTDDLASA